MASWNDFAQDAGEKLVGAAAPRGGAAAAGSMAAGGARMQVTCWSDGSSRGNPGPGGYGTVLRYVDPAGGVHEREFSHGYRRTTNNRMELMGAIVGLEALGRPAGGVAARTTEGTYHGSRLKVRRAQDGRGPVA